MKYFKFLFLLIFFLASAAQAVGVEVKPSNINIIYPDEKETSLSINNISQEPILVSVVTDHFGDSISVQPDEFQLLPDEIIKLKLSLDFENSPEGVKSTYISIVSKPLDRQSFNAATGIKIPMTININKSRWQWSGPSVFVASFLSLLLIIFIIQGILFLLGLRHHSTKWYINLLKHHKKPWYRRIWSKIK